MEGLMRYLTGNAQPGTMPAAVPGALPSSLGPLPPLGGGGGGNMGVPSQPLPAGAIPGAPSPFLPPAAPGPDSMKYEAVTQADGSILLHLKNPDGSLGPAVKIINAPKPSRPQQAM